MCFYTSLCINSDSLNHWSLDSNHESIAMSCLILLKKIIQQCYFQKKLNMFHVFMWFSSLYRYFYAKSVTIFHFLQVLLKKVLIKFHFTCHKILLNSWTSFYLICQTSSQKLYYKEWQHSSKVGQIDLPSFHLEK